MGRVTASEVKSIIETTLTDGEVDAYISSANVMVTQNLGSSTVLSSDELKEIERWLTAHMIAITRERVIKKAAAGPASVEYAGVFGKDLDSTQYGQTVKLLDRTGTLAGLGMKRLSIISL